MTDAEILDILAECAVLSCEEDGLCTCGRITDRLERVLPLLHQRARARGIRRGNDKAGEDEYEAYRDASPS